MSIPLVVVRSWADGSTRFPKSLRWRMRVYGIHVYRVPASYNSDRIAWTKNRDDPRYRVPAKFAVARIFVCAHNHRGVAHSAGGAARDAGSERA